MSRLSSEGKALIALFPAAAPSRQCCHRPIVVDKFHVMRMANEALEKVRKGLRKELTAIQRLHGVDLSTT